ncbi:restriction endonuclease subunit S [Streptomyces europaeiscabiei]|uniref:restriction endonuclease subunit S n=1 Tax=Streptomyces europaeiscabiei TaxID=146819 RepID=UPI0029BC67FC|nr:restriction endonuclease subunit S [Streptomyces europaeiscabiei]MDX2526787.1 restriction endonuclease subunit S [Streptomyces europaeiscabiei]MDX3782340.1 restriction endonuclease subunit S [Streptomyces europaeiscabiei]MDX3831850.1 restriction endonuclease subunit S [Streptomyces europaeiscabiei]
MPGEAWPEVPLTEILDRLEVGIASAGPESVPGPGEWGIIRLGAVTSGKFVPWQVKRLPESVTPRRSLEIRQGDVLVVRVNGSPGLVGSVCVVGHAPPRLMLSDLVMRLGPDPRVMDSAFLGMALSARSVRRQIVAKFRGTSGQFQLPQSELKSVLVPCPPVPEQRRIVEVIDGVAELERGIEASIAKLRSVRQGTLLDYMSRIQPEWTCVRDLGEVRMGKQLSPDSRSAGEHYPYLRVANVHAGRIDYSDVKTMGFTKGERSVYGLVPGDILLNEGQSLELVGRSAIYKEEAGKYFFQNTLVRFRSAGRVTPEYAQIIFEYWLQAGVFAGIAKKTTSIAHLGGERFAGLEFPLVSLAEQQDLVTAISSCDSNIEDEGRELNKLRELKQGLVDDLLSGRIAVSVAAA